MSLQEPDRTITPGGVRMLSHGEHLVIFGLRAMATGQMDCPVVRRAFEALLAGNADRTLGDLLVFVRLLALAATRRLRVHAPGCCALSGDEVLMLSAIGAAQTEPAADGAHGLRAALGRLCDAPPSTGLALATVNLAETLTRGGVDLGTMRAGLPGSATRH